MIKNIFCHHPYPAHRKNFPLLVLVVGTALGFCLPLRAYPLQTLTTNVTVMNGTDSDGNTFPGSLVPFGMIQWSPDTMTGQRPGGYSYTDTQIAGFSLDHVSGAGCPYGEDFAFSPILGNVTVSPASAAPDLLVSDAVRFARRFPIGTSSVPTSSSARLMVVT